MSLNCYFVLSQLFQYRAGPGRFSFGRLRQRGNAVGCKDNVALFQREGKRSSLFSVWSPSSFCLECTALQVWGTVWGPAQDNKAEKSRVRKGAAKKMWESEKNLCFVDFFKTSKETFSAVCRRGNGISRGALFLSPPPLPRGGTTEFPNQPKYRISPVCLGLSSGPPLLQ